jgi:hypothetical protein
MIFTLEALNAKWGDCLLLHVGEEDALELVLIDGGPAGVYRATLRPRLDELAARRAGGEPLAVKLAMVSHLDADHITGLLDLARDLAEREEDREALPYDLGSLWMNSFDDVIGPGGVAMLEAVAEGAASPGSGVASAASRAVGASVGQGRTLRDLAQRLGLRLNRGRGDLIAAPADRKLVVEVTQHLSFTVVAPSRKRLDELQQEWDEVVERAAAKDRSAALAKAAEYLDRSVFNLSSTVVLAEACGRRMLLTGDARGDDVLAGLDGAGLMEDGTIHVDVLKLPHHGSDHNVEPDFFRRVTADHYVISADGSNGNPEVATLRMLSDARGAEEFSLHLTNAEPRLRSFFKKERSAGKRYDVRFREPRRPSLLIDCCDPYAEGAEED